MPANALPQRAESYVADWRCWVLTEEVTQVLFITINSDSSSRVDRREAAADNCMVVFKMNQVNSSQLHSIQDFMEVSFILTHVSTLAPRRSTTKVLVFSTTTRKHFKENIDLWAIIPLLLSLWVLKRNDTDRGGRLTRLVLV